MSAPTSDRYDLAASFGAGAAAQPLLRHVYLTRMRPHALTVLVLGALLASPAAAQNPDETEGAGERYIEDFGVFWHFVADEYAYFDQKRVDWPRVLEVYGPEAAAATDDGAFLGVLERALAALYDPHAHFDTNTRDSPRLVPSDTDLWAQWRDGEAVVTDVRAGSNAAAAGLRPGAVIRQIDGRPVAEVVRNRMPQALRGADPAARDWALRAALAGTHAGPVRLTVEVEGHPVPFEFTPGVARPATLLTLDRLRHDVGYVRVNNSLGDAGLIAAFDSALAALRGTRGLVLDLRETPSGGNTTGARGIMSRLVETERPYQRHELVAEERAFGVRRVWVEYVEPRGRSLTPSRSWCSSAVGRGAWARGSPSGWMGWGGLRLWGPRWRGCSARSRSGSSQTPGSWCGCRPSA